MSTDRWQGTADIMVYSFYKVQGALFVLIFFVLLRQHTQRTSLPVLPVDTALITYLNFPFVSNIDCHEFSSRIFYMAYFWFIDG